MAERSTCAMLLEPPHPLSQNNPDGRQTWRHMKSNIRVAVESPDRTYRQTRMNAAQDPRRARRLLRGGGRGPVGRPQCVSENLQWEALVNVLRARAKPSVHCYEAAHLDAHVRGPDALVRIRVRFAASMQGKCTYLVPDLPKRAWVRVLRLLRLTACNLPAIAHSSRPISTWCPCDGRTPQSLACVQFVSPVCLHT
ncbi:hypothetical protein GGX14DRAFT_588007 [Mycena pura]|uniref:Uncharacterized protein n=1 Tax=Mycena pura TaxID=153505 RepID=A0AAD6UU59_9AGAR|nr:hypothetical protein GGX14DRAFT_588007 [Mycena pura]